MGASGWSYFVAYEADIGAALERLKRDVFERGDYLLLDDWSLWAEADQRIAAGENSKVVQAERKAKRDELPRPSSIAELFEWNMESGTHSILDMTKGIANAPEFGAVSPLTEAQLITAFGTTQPTHARVGAWAEPGTPLIELRRRWEGLYLIVYDGDSPTELYFAGFSGD